MSNRKTTFTDDLESIKSPRPSPRPRTESAASRKSTWTEESASVKVCVRVRPWIKEEIEGTRNDGQPLVNCIRMDTTTSCTIMGQKKGVGDKEDHFEFDRCFWSHTEEHPLYANQAVIYEELGQSLLSNA